MKKSRHPKFFPNTWDRIVFVGSILGLLFLAVITFYRSHQLKEQLEEFENKVTNHKAK